MRVAGEEAREGVVVIRVEGAEGVAVAGLDGVEGATDKG